MPGLAFAGLRHEHIFGLYDQALRRPDLELTGFWEEDEAARAAAAQRLPLPCYPDYETLLRDPRVSIVAVGDYYGIRGSRILRALRAGKHVISDKPLCTDLGELAEMEKLSREKGLFVGCLLDLRYDPALRLAQKLVQAGEIGPVHAVNFTGQHALQYGVRPGWYFEPGKHGGTINDLSIHGIDAVAMITGLKQPRVLCARQWNAFAAREPAFADCAQFMLAYENGAGLVADVSYSAPMPAAFSLPSYWRFSFWGEGGMLECRLGQGAVLLAKEGRAAEALAAPPVPSNALNDLMQSIQGKPAAFDPHSVFSSSRIALTIQEAAKEMQT